MNEITEALEGYSGMTDKVKTGFSTIETFIRTIRVLSFFDVTNGKQPDINLLDLPITFDVYQEGTKWTAAYPENLPVEVYTAMGLAGETGEVMEKIKKLYRDGLGDKTEEEFNDMLSKELGDVLYYLSALALNRGIKLSDIAKNNQYKLLNRLHKNTIHGSGDNR